MDTLRLADIIAAALAIGSIAGLLLIAAKSIQHSRNKKEEFEKTILERARIRQAAKKEAANKNAMQESLRTLQTRTEQVRKQEAEADKRTAEHAAMQHDKINEEINQWLANEQAETAWIERLLTAEERLEAQRLVAKRAEVDCAIAEWVAAVEGEEAEAREQEIEQTRSASKRIALDQAITEWVDLESELRKHAVALPPNAEREALEDAIEQWAAVEQAAAERTEDDHRPKESATAEHASAEKSLTARIAAEQAAMSQTMPVKPPVRPFASSPALSQPPTGKKVYKRSQAIKEQVLVTAQHIEQEAKDLNHIINKLDTSAAFMPVYVQNIIEKWKKGEIYRHSTLEDLQLKFRYQAYSMFDGWEVLNFYHSWIMKQRHKLLIFLQLLGIERNQSEGILSMVERAERAEWAKHLNMDMDVLFILRKIREIYQLTESLKTRLQDLERVCRKYSDQIVAPPWEPKETL